MSANLQLRRENWDGWIATETRSVIASLPCNVDEADLKRSATRLRLAFSKLPGHSKIYECTADSVVSCIVMSAMTGLFPGGHNPDVDLIPRRDNKDRIPRRDNKDGGKMKLNWQISYRGYGRLCRRTTGWDIRTTPVFDDDKFKRGISSELGEWFEYEPGPGESGDPAEDWQRLTGVLVIIDRPAANNRIEFVTKKTIERRRAKAQTQKFWKEWPIEKAMATAIRYAGQREWFPTDDPTRYALSLGEPHVEAQERPRSLLPDLNTPKIQEVGAPTIMEQEIAGKGDGGAWEPDKDSQSAIEAEEVAE